MDYFFNIAIFASILVFIFIFDKLRIKKVFTFGPIEKFFENNNFMSIIIFAFSILILFLFNKHETVPYNNYSYLTDALLHGRFDIPNMPLFLEQVSYAGKTYMHFAPGPSILLLPFIALFGMTFNIGVLSIILGAANCVVFFNILNRLNFKNLNTRLWLTTLFGFGTVHFFLAALGHSWFLGHVSATFLILLSLLFVLNTATKMPYVNLFFSGFFFAFAVTCRLSFLLSAPLFILIIIFHRKLSIKGLIAFGCGAFIPGFLYMLYNYLRYNTIMDLGYYLTFEKDNKGETGGPLQLKYIGYNLYSLFLMGPRWITEFPYIYPSLTGLAVTFTTPAIFYAFKAKSKWYFIVGLWVSVILTAIPFAMNYGNGTAQFGMRYSMDFLPFVLILAALGLRGEDNQNLNNLQKILILVCVFINGWGTIIWNMGLQQF